MCSSSPAGAGIVCRAPGRCAAQCGVRLRAPLGRSQTPAVLGPPAPRLGTHLQTAADHSRFHCFRLLQSSKPCARAGRTLQAQVLDMRRHRSMQCRGTCSLALALAILAAVVGGRSDGTPRHSARSRSTQAAAAVPCRSRCRRRPQLFPLRAHCRWRHVMPPQPYLTRAGGWWSAACASCPRSPLQRRRQRGSATPCPAAAPTTPAASTCRPPASSSVPRMPLTARPPWPLPTPTHRRVRGGWTGVITHRGAPLGAAAACPPALC